MPPMNRPGGPQGQQKTVDELTIDEARLALAQSRSTLGTDDDFEIILDSHLKTSESSLRTQRANQKDAIIALEARVTELTA